MTGLAIAAPPTGNLGALLGVPENSGVAGAVAVGGLAFLDLLGFIGEGMAAEEPTGESAEVDEGPLKLQSTVPQTTPKKIAEAILRTMLQAPVSPSIEAVVVEQSEPPAVERATVIEENWAEDWDVPLDWVAPEEEHEEFVCEDPRPEAFQPEDYRYFDGQMVVDRPFAGTSVIVANQTDVPLEVRTRVRALAPVALPRKTALPEHAAVLRARLMEPLAPLVFALKLRAPDASEVRVDGPVQAQGVAGVALVKHSDLPAKEVANIVVGLEAIAAEAPVFDDSGDDSGSGQPPVQSSSEQQNQPQGKETEAAAPAVPVRVRAAKAWARTEVPFTEAPNARAIPAAPQVAATPPAREVPVRPVETAAAAVPSAPSMESTGLGPPRAHSTHEIAVRISAPDAAPVDVQVKERGGEVHVAVRTPDGVLQTSLRQDLGTLMDRLEQTGLHTEAIATRESGLCVEAGSGFDLGNAFRAQAAEASGGPSRDQPQERDGSSARDHGAGARQQNPQRRQQQPQRWAGLPQDEEQA